MSLFVGPRVGLLVGIKAYDGVASSSLAGVTRDATSGKYTPASLAEWQIVLAAAGIVGRDPTSLWLMGEGSGNLADTIGARTMTAASTPGYVQSIAGWTRPGVTFTDGGASRFTSTIGAGNTTSHASLFYTAVTATPAATRSIVQHPNMFTEINTSPRYQANGGSLVVGTVAPGVTVHPVFTRSNVTLSALGVHTDAEDLEPTWFADTTTTLSLGGAANATPQMWTGYGVGWEGAPAEFTKAQIRTLLTTLGW